MYESYLCVWDAQSGGRSVNLYIVVVCETWQGKWIEDCSFDFMLHGLQMHWMQFEFHHPFRLLPLHFIQCWSFTLASARSKILTRKKIITALLIYSLYKVKDFHVSTLYPVTCLNWASFLRFTTKMQHLGWITKPPFSYNKFSKEKA